MERKEQAVNKKVNDFYKIEINGEKVYAVKHIPSGVCAIFDHNKEILEQIQNEMKKRKRQLTPRKDGALKFGKSKGYPHTSLATFLYSCYHGIPIEEISGSGIQVRHKRLLHSEGLYEDCRKENIYMTNEIVMDNAARSISFTEDGKYIAIYIKTHNVTEYVSNSPEMLELIGKPSNVSFFVNKGGRTQVKFNHPLEDQNLEPYLNILAFACYHFGVTEANARTVLPVVMRMFDGDNYDIDHINSDIRNNCRWNLADKKSELNISKHNHTARVKPPYFLYVVITDTGDYRIKFGYKYRNWGQEFYVVCPDAENLNNFLRKIVTIDKAPGFLKREWAITKLFQSNRKAKHAALDFEKCSKEAERLLSMESDSFTIWREDSRFIVS